MLRGSIRDTHTHTYTHIVLVVVVVDSEYYLLIYRQRYWLLARLYQGHTPHTKIAPVFMFLLSFSSAAAAVDRMCTFFIMKVAGSIPRMAIYTTNCDISQLSRTTNTGTWLPIPNHKLSLHTTGHRNVCILDIYIDTLVVCILSLLTIMQHSQVFSLFKC